MKTTIEISDVIFRAVKASASLKGQTLKAFFLEAIKDKLVKESKHKNQQDGWRKAFGKVPASVVSAVQDKIEEEFSNINPEDWK